MKKSIFLGTICTVLFLAANAFPIRTGNKGSYILNKYYQPETATLTFTAQSLPGGGYSCAGITSDLYPSSSGANTIVGNWVLFKDGIPYQILGPTTGSYYLNIQFNIPPGAHGTFYLGVSYTIYVQGQPSGSGYLASNSLTL